MLVKGHVGSRRTDARANVLILRCLNSHKMQKQSQPLIVLQYHTTSSQEP